jgi:hypothetical protein
VPAAFGGGKYDIWYSTKEEFAEVYKNIVSYKFLPRGGHFLALGALLLSFMLRLTPSLCRG